jgi:Basic region leucine zipper
MELLSRDRSQCSPEELDKIRRERNRMHAKRTRDRKRLFTERLADMSRLLQDENAILKEYLLRIDPHFKVEALVIEDSFASVSTEESSCSNSIEDSPVLAPKRDVRRDLTDITLSSQCMVLPQGTEINMKEGKARDSLSTLLQAAGCFEKQSSMSTRTGFNILAS